MGVECAKCAFKKRVGNPAKGVKLPGKAQGKCTRPGGFCDEKLQEIEEATENRKIEIKTGNGEDAGFYVWNLGPINLVRAVEALADYQASVVKKGLVAGEAWLEVAGIRLTEEEVETYWKTPRALPYLSIKGEVPKMQWARSVISLVESGMLPKKRRSAGGILRGGR